MSFYLESSVFNLTNWEVQKRWEPIRNSEVSMSNGSTAIVCLLRGYCTESTEGCWPDIRVPLGAVLGAWLSSRSLLRTGSTWGVHPVKKRTLKSTKAPAVRNNWPKKQKHFELLAEINKKHLDESWHLFVVVIFLHMQEYRLVLTCLIKRITFDIFD